MFSTCKLCDLPCKESAIQRHMNRAHHSLSSSELNHAESANRASTDTYNHNRWVDCPSCYSNSGAHQHFLGVRGLRQHESRSHPITNPPTAATPHPHSNPPPSASVAWPRSPPPPPAQHTARHANIPARSTSVPSTATPSPSPSPTASTPPSAPSRPTSSSSFPRTNACPSNFTSNSTPASPSLLQPQPTVPRRYAVSAVWPRSAPPPSTQPKSFPGTVIQK